MYNPIESRKFPDKNINFCLCDEPLVEVRDFLFEPHYLKRNIRGATDRCFMRKGVYERLKLAQSYLPGGVRIKIYDAWRPFEVQLALYEDYRSKLEEENPGCTKEEIDNLTKLFVSLPVMDETEGPVHATGGALDVTLADENGEDIDMGTEFDFFGEMANTDYFEKQPINDEVRNNRRMLYYVMTKAGFTNLPTEWWHYDFGNKFHSFYTGKDAVYGCVFDVK